MAPNPFPFLSCPGGTTCTQLQHAARRNLVVSGEWALALAGLTPEHGCARTVLCHGRASRARSRLGVHGAPMAEVVSRSRIAPARRSTCACRFEYHDVPVALVEVTRSITRHGGAQRVGWLFSTVLRRFELHLDGAPVFDPSHDRGDRSVLDLRRFADIVAYVPERVARSRLASFLRIGTGTRTDGATPRPWSTLEQFLRDLTHAGVSAWDERPLDPQMRGKVGHRSTGETVWQPLRKW